MSASDDVSEHPPLVDGQVARKPVGHVTEMTGHVPEFGGHDAETVGHDGPKYAADCQTADVNVGYGATCSGCSIAAFSLKQVCQRQKPFSQHSLNRARFPPLPMPKINRLIRPRVSC